MKFTKLVIGAMLMASAAAASAEDIVTTKTLTLTSGDDVLVGLFDHTFNGAAKNKTFLDIYNFTFTSASDVASTFSAPAIIKGKAVVSDLSFSSFSLYQGSTLLSSGDLSSGLTPKSDAGALATSLSAGTYSLRISGKVLGNSGGNYTGSVNVSPVPEPETWGMMASGMAALGFLARRRKKNA